MNKDLFQYSGKINVTLNNTTRKYRNNGTARLFRIFAQSLVKPELVGANEVPSQITLEGMDVNNSYKDALYYPIEQIYKEVVETIGGYAMKISFTLLPTNINNSENKHNYKLCLKNNDNEELAYAIIDDEIINAIDGGYQALVEWILEVTNVLGENEDE